MIDCRGSLVHALACGLLLLAAKPALADQSKIDALVAATKSSDETTRLQAIQALGHQGGPAVAPLMALLKSKSAVERVYAATALGAIGAPAKGAADGLIVLLADSDPSVRRSAIAAISRIRPGPAVTVPLFVKLMNDADPGVRMRVMAAVADAKGAAVPALIEALKNDKADYWACIILRDIGPDAAPAVPALIEKLKDKRPEIRREAVLALASIGSADAVPKLVPLLKDEHAKIAATYAMGVLGKVPAEAESILRQNAESKDALLSTTSLWALVREHPENAKLMQFTVSHLVARLQDKDPFVRAAAARALVALPPNPSITGPIFEKALADADETTTHYMLDALAGLGPQAVPKLIKALDYTALRPQVIQILGQIGPAAADATESLAKLVGDADPNTAIEAAHALAKIGPGAKAAVPQLIAAVKDPEHRASHAAIYALGRIGAPAAAAEPVLLETIKSADDSLSLESAWALVRIRGEETADAVMPDLLAGLASEQPESRATAAEVLGELGPAAKSAVPQLEAAAKDPDVRVRAMADKALKSIAE